MDSYLLSFTLYAVPANLIGGMFYVVGKQKAGLLKAEYPFIYLPWLALVVLSWGFFDVADQFHEISLRVFILVLQSVGCGVLGGLVLWPRFIFPVDTTYEKLRLTCISALAAVGIYIVTRILLFSAIRAVL